MKRTMGLCVAALGMTLAFGTGCKKGGAEGGAGGAEPSAAAKEEATNIFKSRCASCHGATGKGDGAASAGLNPKPRNFSDAAWQKGATDEHLENIIVKGGAAVGKSAAMPSNPDLEAKVEVVKALRMHIRTLAGK